MLATLRSKWLITGTLVCGLVLVSAAAGSASTQIPVIKQTVTKQAVAATPPGRGVGNAGPFVRGQFATNCTFTHSATDDPIVHNGMPGMSHLHNFFGNTTTDANSSTASLLAGGTTCRESADRSAYWTPALLQDGVVAVPEFARIYYLGTRGRIVEPLPNGYKMISGFTNQTVRWTCTLPGGIVIKRGANAATVPTCSGAERLVAHVRFPNCWDGHNLDSADHKSHAVFPVRGRCPAEHNVRVPEISVNVHYPASVHGGSGVSLVSGGPETMHADAFLAWQGERQRYLVARCLNTHSKCGAAQRVR